MNDTQSKDIHIRRMMIVAIVIIAASVFILGNFFYIMIITPNPNTESNNSDQLVERGPILDRNGTILAMQTRLDTVTAWIPSISEPRETADLLADILDLDGNELYQQFITNDAFIYIKRTISPEQSQQIKQLQEEQQLEGIYLQESFGRNYPEESLACHVLGYVGIDNHGLDGIEYYYDTILTEADNQQQGDRFGNQIRLTIDAGIQQFTDDLAQQTREEHNADSTIIIVMNSQTGEILSYSAAPLFDPNHFNRYSAEERRNLPINYLYEPGSVFKIFTISSFLHLNAITPDQTYQAQQPYRRYKNGQQLFQISDLGAYGVIDTTDIIRLSSNVGAAYASDNVSNEQLYHMIRQFGFGEKTGIDLNGEQRGILRPPESWSDRSKPTITIGQEIAVSALQLVSAATVFTNEGILLQPQLVSQIISPEGKIIQDFQRQAVRRVISPGTARIMLDMMTRAAEDGTGRRTQIEGIDIATKTGTAQMLDPDTGQYSETAFIASSLSILPANEPRAIVYTAIIHPRSDSFYGGRIAAPVVKEIAEFLVPYLNIPRTTDTVVQETSGIRIQQNRLPIIGSTMPSFIGFPKRTLMPLYESAPCSIIIRGNGWVARQSPPPGTPVTPQTELILELE